MESQGAPGREAPEGASGSSLDKRRILILAGTSEARALAVRLCARQDLAVTLSLAGRTRDPLPLPGPTRVGGFGGVAGLVDYLRQSGIALLVDATHPFAEQISRNAHQAAAELGLPLLSLERPAWRPREGDRWIRVASVAEAVAALGARPRRVFLAIGRQEAGAFAAAPQHHYLVRSVEAVEPPLAVPRVDYLLARGPFAAEDEQALLEAKGIEVVVCKNSGGSATYGKLAAARKLGLEVVMIERAPAGTASRAESVEEALPLVDHLLASAAKRGV